MDHKFTEQIRQWLEKPESERDYTVGALYLLKLSGNQIMYKNIIAQIDRRHDFVEYQLQKYYNFRVQALTHAQVEEMAAQVATIADEKYLLINQGFAGKQRLMPFFNRQNNDDLILAIQAAGVSRGRNGFRKDKGGEKLAESEEDLLEHRTDGTDAFDTLYIGCEKFPFHDSFSLSLSGVQ